MRKETIDKIINIVIKWNCRKIESDEAMLKLWDILQDDEDKELQEAWNEKFSKPINWKVRDITDIERGEGWA